MQHPASRKTGSVRAHLMFIPKSGKFKHWKKPNSSVRLTVLGNENLKDHELPAKNRKAVTWFHLLYSALIASTTHRGTLATLDYLASCLRNL